MPGVVTIVDNNLDHAGLPVVSMSLTPTATVNYVYDCPVGAPVSATGSGTFVGLTTTQQADGCHIISAEVTSGSLAAGNIRPTDTAAGTWQRVRFNYVVAPGTPISGAAVTNSATATVSYPGYALADVSAGPATRSVLLRELPKSALTPTINAALPTAAVAGGGQAVPGSAVTFTVAGATANIPLNAGFRPQYVFVAPAGWKITNGSAIFPAGSGPATATFEYRTATIAGVVRDVVVATWPVGTNFGASATLPTMTVVGSPTFAVTAGTSSIYEAWVGDAAHNWTNTTASMFGAAQDVNNIDGDASSAEWLSRRTASILVSSADAMAIIKEICRPDASAADGCDWVSDPSNSVPVSTIADDIRYRVTIRNTGNTNLTGVVGYDVLPHVGDTGTTDASAGTPRGSEFEQTLISVSNVSGSVTLSYSGSTQPARPEVYTGGGSTNDWASTAAGKRAIRIVVNGALSPGAAVTFQYLAEVGAGATADAVACNSVAVAATQIGILEPSAVCATTAEADLLAGGAATISPQLGRPTVLPFQFSNLGGTSSAPAEIVIAIPAGVTVADLTVADWTCTSPQTAPFAGPGEVTCVPTAATLERGDPALALNLPVIVTTPGVAITARVSGDLYDPLLSNNAHTITIPTAAPAATGALTVSKTDGVPALVEGQQATYTITVENPLEFEALVDVVVSDVLPAGLTFVSATAGGVNTAGTVAWTIPSIPAGGSATVTVTVQLAATTLDQIENTVTVTAPDPAFPGDDLTGTAEDLDLIDRIELTKTAAVASGAGVEPRPGDVVTYTFTATNTGGGVLTGVQIDDLMVGLSPIAVVSWPGATGELEVGESVVAHATYTLTATDTDGGTVTNTATVTGDSAGGGSATDSSGVQIDIDPEPALSLVKSASPGTLVVGQVVTYSFVVTNTGNVTVTGVTIDETAFSGSGIPPTVVCGPAAASLAPDEQVVCEATYQLTQDDVNAATLSNTASAIGTTPQGVVTSPPSTVTLPFDQEPSLDLVKSADVTSYDAVGDVINYVFRVTNTGNVTMGSVAIVEESFSGGGASLAVTCPAVALLPGQYADCTAAAYTLVQADLDAGSVSNTASATATATGLPTTSSGPSSVTVPFAGATGIELVKTATPVDVNRDGIITAGDRVTWSFVVTNTGVATLTALSVLDPTAGTVTCASTTLAPGASTNCTVALHNITVAESVARSVTNTATATATAAGAAISSAPATATVPVQFVPLAFTGSTVTTTALAMALLGSLLLLIAGALLVRRRRAEG